MPNKNIERLKDREVLAMACVCLMMKTDRLADAIRFHPDSADAVFVNSISSVWSIYENNSHSMTFTDIGRKYYTDFEIKEDVKFDFYVFRDALYFAIDRADALFFEPMIRRDALMQAHASKFSLSEMEFRFLVSNSRTLERMVSL